MLQNLLLEFMGTLLICATVMYTHANPLMVGFAHTTALYMHSSGYFNPLYLFLEVCLGRIPLGNAITIFAIQCSAVMMFALTYIHIPLE